ncbi:MAG: nitroreductase family protein [Deltaproteobacteria bacterium]|nr:nitroreductase family protein [Deltaproteobacteria bacterium]MBW1923506.1 nitroreductase family protein [Deltaproteobacteria bacterium]MBW1949883.1 nitroreductase family protein [Deltaproteobacteria bacterium]MBW2008471.1 nitroreductase family protein [Deltaproteobacteria bacterium]MBW2101378.1 nitroreductase family protein [Deltaproteobacteria bacterium]
MEFTDLIMRRRSIRDFHDRPVPLETIHELIEEACLAPSSGNGQPWRFVVVRGRDWIDRLSDESKRNILDHLERNPDSGMARYRGTLENPSFNVFYSAPCVVIVGGSREVATNIADCTLAACYFMMGAAARGLGTCWVGLGANLKDPELRGELGMEDDFQIVAPLALGYPKKIPRPPRRKPAQIVEIGA